MRGSIGQILLQQGVIDAAALSDALARQGGHHPVASVLYNLGYCTERELVTALSIQSGWMGIVLEESTIVLEPLAHVTAEWSRIFNALVVSDDGETLVVAAARPEDAIVPVRELGEDRGRHVELRIALDIVLARTIRTAFRHHRLGEKVLVGALIEQAGPHLAIVQPDGAVPSHEGEEQRRAQRALAEDAARSIESREELPEEYARSMTGDWQVITTTTEAHEAHRDSLLDLNLEQQTMIITADIDRGAEPTASTGRVRALVVDPDPPGRIQLVAELERLGYECQAAATGNQAVDLLRQIAFDVVFADIATPDADGLRLCRAIKASRRLARTRVVVTTSVVDSGQVPDETLQKHGADGYLEKPLDTRRLHRMLRDVATEERDGHEALLAEALGRYHGGDIDGAIARLRGGLVGDPSSPKLHFILANMLQRASRWAEAVDEYEAVVELQPAYFPALTRLAYLYYRQGLHARAVETWRRALPVCEDPALRRSIELFMRKLVADMAKAEA